MPRNAATKKFLQRTQNAAISLDGSTSFLAKASPTGINNGTNGSVTIAGWVKLKASTLGTVAELHVNGGTSPSFGMGEIGGLYFVFSDRVNVSNNKIIMATQFNQYVGLNRWVFLTYILTPTTFSLYAGDTALLSDSALATAINAGTISNFFIGKGQTTAQADIQFLNGIVKDFRVYNGALTAQQVSDLYYSALNASTVADAWGMDEGAGSTVTDAIGTNNLTGTALTWTSDRPFAAKKASVNANMVKNGNFEYAPPFTAATTTANRYIDGTSGGSATNILFGWKHNSGAGPYSVRFDPTVSHSGGTSLLISATDVLTSTYVDIGPGIAASKTLLELETAIRITPSTSYLLTGYIKTTNVPTNGAFLQFTSYDGAGTRVDNTASTTKLSGTADWTLISQVFTSGATARFATIGLMKNVAGNISDAWFDDISLTPVYPEGRVPANGNLVKNFDFEVAPTFVAATTTGGRWIDGSAAGSSTNATYKWYNINIGNFAASFDSTVFRSGLYSMKIEATSSAGRGRIMQTPFEGSTTESLIRQWGTPVLPSTSYTLSCYIKTNNASASSIRTNLQWYDGIGTAITTDPGAYQAATQDFTLVTQTVTSPAGAQYVRLLFEQTTTGSICQAWFDDIYLAPTTNPGRVLIT